MAPLAKWGNDMAANQGSPKSVIPTERLPQVVKQAEHSIPVAEEHPRPKNQLTTPFVVSVCVCSRVFG